MVLDEYFRARFTAVVYGSVQDLIPASRSVELEIVLECWKQVWIGLDTDQLGLRLQIEPYLRRNRANAATKLNSVQIVLAEVSDKPPLGTLVCTPKESSHQSIADLAGRSEDSGASIGNPVFQNTPEGSTDRSTTQD